MKFEYKDIGSRRKRPFIPITLRNPKNHKEVQCYALVDSGSDCNLFSPVLGEIIGIDVQNGIQRPIAGVVAGEKRSYFEHEVEFVIGEQAFATKVGFMPSMSTQAGEGIVGQTGFFDRFSFVKFNKGKHLIELGQFKMPEDGL